MMNNEKYKISLQGSINKVVVKELLLVIRAAKPLENV